MSIAGLAAGRVEVEASPPGFWIWRWTFHILNGAELSVEARLEVGTVGGGGMVIEPLLGRLMVAVVCAGGASGTARTDAKGVASFTALPAGDCLVTVRSPGFREWRGSVALTAGSQGRLAARLEVSDPGTRLEVRPKRPVRRFMDWLSSCARR